MAAKTWFTTTCSKHGTPSKGQPFKEIIVPPPGKGSKMLGRHRSECPMCRIERLKEEGE